MESGILTNRTHALITYKLNHNKHLYKSKIYEITEAIYLILKNHKQIFLISKYRLHIVIGLLL